MSPVEIQVSAVERVQLEAPTTSAATVAADAVEQIQLPAPTSETVTVEGVSWQFG